MAFVEFEKVSKLYHTGAVEIPALRDATFQVEKGEICVIVGASGAGKTTLLNILGGMDTLTGGTVKLDGRDISRYDRRQLTEYRRHDVGFVFQFYNLIQNLTALENVEIAAQLCPHPLDAAEVLREVGLGERMKNFPVTVGMLLLILGPLGGYLLFRVETIASRIDKTTDAVTDLRVVVAAANAAQDGRMKAVETRLSAIEQALVQQTEAIKALRSPSRNTPSE